MRTVVPPSCLATGAIRRSTAPPSSISMISELMAGSRPVVSDGNCLWLWVCMRSAPFGGGGGRGFDAAGDELGVALDPAQQRRAARVLPGEAEEVQAGDVGDTAAVAQAAVLVGDVEIDPGVVGPVAGRPDDGVDVELRAVGEAHRPPRAADRPRPEGDTERAPQL